MLFRSRPALEQLIVRLRRTRLTRVEVALRQPILGRVGELVDEEQVGPRGACTFDEPNASMDRPDDHADVAQRPITHAVSAPNATGANRVPSGGIDIPTPVADNHGSPLPVNNPRLQINLTKVS